MDLNVHDNNIEAGELFEECWFFRNLLDRRTRILRSFSDPCTSSNYSQDNNFPGKSYDQMYESIKKQHRHNEYTMSNLIIREPSMPPCLERKDQNPTTKGTCTDPTRSKSNRKGASSNNLFRAPSLPNSFGIEEFQDEETEFSMGKLIRQASMNSSDTLSTPRTRAAKGVTQSCSISRHRSRMKRELESIKLEGLETQKSLRDIEPEDCLQGLKDLGFNNFDKRDTNPDVISINQGLQEKETFKEDEEKNSSCSVPNWGGKKPKEEDMKAQIKFWARAVASNVR